MKKKVKKVENRGIDSAELILALEELEKEKGIKKDYVLESIETALVTAYKRNFDVNSENVKVTMNPETGETHVYEELDVVEEVEDPATQISLEDAKKIDVKYKAGDVVEKELMPKNFGRIAAQTAKQVIVQRIREASRDVIFNEFTEKKGEIISGIVQKVDKSIVVIDLGKIEGIMPLKEQIPTENYYVNQKLRACVADVEKGPKGSTQIIVSRANNEFLRKLFELEIPEIYEGLIEIKSVSRDPGLRSKVAVYSPDPNIDPVGSCVGQKGVRIQNVINELNGEKILYYEAAQKQRQLENAIRKTKRAIQTLEKAGEDTEVSKSRLATLNKRLNDFCKETGLEKDHSRTTVAKTSKQSNYNDITNQFNLANQYEVKEKQYYKAEDGTKYNADGKHVILSPTTREKEVAEILGKVYGGQVNIIPRVNEPANIKTPDYIINNERFDLKEITGSGKYVIEGNIRKKKNQANNFIIDITNTKMDIKEIERQIASIYISKRYLWVDKIFIVKENDIIKAYKRK